MQQFQKNLMLVLENGLINKYGVSYSIERTGKKCSAGCKKVMTWKKIDHGNKFVALHLKPTYGHGKREYLGTF